MRSLASDRQLRHELAHARFVRASYERLQGHPDTARRLLTEVLPVFRKAGDFRCTARTLRELAQPSVNGDPGARTELLLESLRAAAIAGGPAIRARVLADLTTAAFSSGNLILAARCAGALEALTPQVPRKAADPSAALPADPALTATMRDPAYATFVAEGRTGGIDLLTRLYSRP